MRGFTRCTPIAVALFAVVALFGCGQSGTEDGSSSKPENETGAVSTNPKDGAEMVWVPAGKFTMGSPAGTGDPDENPQHEVYLDGFWMYKHEVTVAQYKEFCRQTGASMPERPSWGWIDGHPIVNVTWDEANAYAEWAGMRLPTEAEWEKAARGTDGRIYPWGNDWDASKCVFDTDGTKSVGSYPSGASPYGCLDMAGNVYEWCSDWYNESYYEVSPFKNPQGPNHGTNRVLRGGSWRNYYDSLFHPRYSGPEGVRALHRGRRDPDDGVGGDVGFRCAASAPRLRE